MRTLASAAALWALVTSSACLAQSVYEEQGHLIRGDRSIATLGPDLFGDRASLYTGGLEFVQTDVSLPGNNALPVQIGRRLATGKSHFFNGLFGEWDLDIPHVKGVFSA